MQQIISKKQLLIVLAAGLTFKLLFLFVIAPYFFGDALLTQGDAHSYVDSFVNLVNTGEYTHNPNYPEASYGRLPAVAFLWGFFYLLFAKPFAFTAFALFQILLDVWVCYMIFKMITRFFTERIALLVTWLYILFPLTYYFVVGSDSYYFTLFIIIAVLYKLVFFKPDLKNCFALGVLLVVGFYTREILMLLIPLSLIYLWRNYSLRTSHYFAMLFLMLILYLPWPIRNYVKSGQVILVKPLSAGYLEHNKDVLSYTYWLYAWHNCDAQLYYTYVYDLKTVIVFPKEIFNSEAEEKLAYNAVTLARQCGAGFLHWQKRTEKPSCNGAYDGLISRSFDMLRDNYAKIHPFNYYIKIPLQNLSKAFFKNSLNNPSPLPGYIFTLTMLVRTLFLLIGIFACYYYRKTDLFKLMFVFFAVIYFFICAILRQVEMRYLFQADVLMLMAAGTLLADLILKKRSKEI